MAHVQNLFCVENFTEELEVTPKNLVAKQRLFVEAHEDINLMKDNRVIHYILIDEKSSVTED